MNDGLPKDKIICKTTTLDCWGDKLYHQTFFTKQCENRKSMPPKISMNTYKIRGETKNGSTDNLSQAIFASNVICLTLPIGCSLWGKDQVSIYTTNHVNVNSIKSPNVTTKC